MNAARKIAPGWQRHDALRRIIQICGFLIAIGAPWLRADDQVARLILLANRDDPDSVRIARHYADVRGVPPENILALPMSRAETITWTEFVRSIWEPLQTELIRRRWIDAIPMRLTDAVGRTKNAFSGHRISYLVICRGVPLRIAHDPALYAPALPFTTNPIFRTNAAAVDSELGLLAYPNPAINAYLPNPLSRNNQPTRFEIESIVKVSRLDGPTVDDALALVDRAVEAERTGLLGRAYVDLGGVHPDGERWLESVAKQLLEIGFDTDVDRAPSTISAAARFDAPVLYFGWYAGSVNGPFTLPDFQFPPGAIALHIHSYSAQTLRSANANWCGPLIARGVTGTVGNVFEPYLQLTHRPDLLLRALIRGENFGDATCYAQPALSWQTIAIGDPLYRPFGNVAAGGDDVRVDASARLADYGVVRRMLEWEARKKPGEAIALARQVQRERPSLVVALALAQRLAAAGDRTGAGEALAFVPRLGTFRSDEWALAHAAAQLLVSGDRAADAVETYRILFQTRTLPAEVKRAWLASAIGAAEAANASRQVEAWRQDLRELNAN